MTETEWLNRAQDLGLISDNAVTLADVPSVDRERAQAVIGKPETLFDNV